MIGIGQQEDYASLWYDWLFDDGLIPQMKYISQIHSPSERSELISVA